MSDHSNVRNGSAVSKFSALHVLYLDRTLVHELDWLPALTSLTVLSLHGSFRIEDFSRLAAAPQLCKLLRAGTRVSNLD